MFWSVYTIYFTASRILFSNNNVFFFSTFGRDPISDKKTFQQKLLFMFRTLSTSDPKQYQEATKNLEYDLN